MLSDGALLKRVMRKNTHAVAALQFSATLAYVWNLELRSVHELPYLVDLNVSSKTLLLSSNVPCFRHLKGISGP